MATRPTDPYQRAALALGDLITAARVPSLSDLEKLPEGRRYTEIRVHVDDLREAWNAWLAVPPFKKGDQP